MDNPKGTKGALVLNIYKQDPSAPLSATSKEKRDKMSAVRPKMHQNSGEALLKSAHTHHKNATTNPQGHTKLSPHHTGHKSTATAPHTIGKVKSTAPTNPKTSKNHAISKPKDVKYSNQEHSKTTHSPQNTNQSTPTNTSIGKKTKHNQSDVASLKRPAPKDESGGQNSNPTKKSRIQKDSNNKDSNKHASDPPNAFMV